MKTLQEDLKTGNFKSYLFAIWRRGISGPAVQRPSERQFVCRRRYNEHFCLFRKRYQTGIADRSVGDHAVFCRAACDFCGKQWFFKKSPEDLAAYLGELPETTYFIFVEEEVDKRGKMYKQVKKFAAW